jgi:hypothetical protein
MLRCCGYRAYRYMRPLLRAGNILAPAFYRTREKGMGASHLVRGSAAVAAAPSRTRQARRQTARRPQTPNDTFWRRYGFDGDPRHGNSCDAYLAPNTVTVGRAWPIFAGELRPVRAAGRRAARWQALLYREDRERGLHAAQAGVGRQPAVGSARVPKGRRHVLVHAAGVDARQVHTARHGPSRPASRWSNPRCWP